VLIKNYQLVFAVPAAAKRASRRTNWCKAVSAFVVIPGLMSLNTWLHYYPYYFQYYFTCTAFGSLGQLWIAARLSTD